MKLKDRVALITGSAKRVGRAIALALAKRGVHIAVHYQHSEREAHATVRQLKRYGVRAVSIQADVSKAPQVDRLVEETIRVFRRIDILINNAAIFCKTPFETITENDWDAHLDINLKGTFLCAHRVGRLMLKHRAGKIINIADWAGERPYKDYLPYCVSKAGVICLTKALAKTLAPHVQVNAVAPGPVLLPPNFSREERTRLIQQVPLKRLGSPQDVAKAIVFLLENDFITGMTLPVDGGRLVA